MTVHVEDVLAAVGSRVDHLRASAGEPPQAEEGWHACDAVTAADLEAVIGGAAADDRQVAASLLVQSYAYRVVAVSLAAFAVGLPWPSPAAAATSVRLAGGRARALCFRTDALGEAGDVGSLVDAGFTSHLVPFVSTVRACQRLGERLVWANIAASCAAAFRAVEGSARERGDAGERTSIRRRAVELLEHAPWLEGTGWFDADSTDWGWQRSACCLWYRTSGGRTCEGCSLRRQEGT
ncbi:MAG: (2Fe-2S)-binding protein [Actinomycetota bacterium]|nr:(2Fe-2S)-binding protein [Actinomycetota bacterium]